MDRLSVLFGLAGLRLLFLAPSREPLLLVAVVWAGLFLVLLALVAVEKQNLLRVAGTHTDSCGSWRTVVKRTTVPQEQSGRP
jgi:hypothetical protein